MASLAALNIWAILASTIMAFVLGGIWYGPLFGAAWKRAIGKTADELKPTPAPFIISFFSALFSATTLAWLIHASGTGGGAAGFAVGAAAGIGLIAAATASDSAFCGWGVKLFAIQAGYRVCYCALMGIILAVWQ